MERVSLLQLSDWLISAGVDPAKMPHVARNAEKLANIYVPMSPGWQNGSADTVIQKLMYAQPASTYTNESGESPPAVQGPVAMDLLPSSSPQDVAGSGEGANLDASLADVYEEAGSFGLEMPPGLQAAMPAPPSVSMPYMGGGVALDAFNGSFDEAPSGGYGDNESGREYTRLPFVPDQNDNYGIGREVNDALRTAGVPGGDAGGGGGGGASDTYWNLRNKLEGIGSGGSSYGSGSYYSGGGGYYDASADKPPKNRGFSKPYDEEQLASTIEGRPTSILPRIAKNESAAGYQYLADMPVEALLALSDAGTRRKSWYGKERVHKKSGYVIPPEFKQGKYTNNLADVYRAIQGGGGEVLDPEAMMNNLLNAKKKSFVGQQFNRKTSTVGSQAEAMSQYLDVIRWADTGGGGSNSALGADIARGAANHDEYLIDQWSNENLKKKKPRRINKSFKRQGYGG